MSTAGTTHGSPLHTACAYRRLEIAKLLLEYEADPSAIDAGGLRQGGAGSSGGSFREDFYYRLCSDVIEVPPLRQRLREDPAELRQLLQHMMNRMMGEAASAEMVLEIEETVKVAAGQDYPWPGNVRELEQAISRILITGSYAAAMPQPSSDPGERLIAAIQAGSLDASGLVAGYCKVLYEKTRSYQAVAKRTNLDWRTVKKYVDGVRLS